MMLDQIHGSGVLTSRLIAVMLGRLRMSVADCITAYLSLSERVFRKTRHRVTVKGQIQGRFDSEELAQAVRGVVKQQGLQKNALLKDAPEVRCKVYVVRMSDRVYYTLTTAALYVRPANRPARRSASRATAPHAAAATC